MANLLKTCRDQYGQRARIDFQMLAEKMRTLRHPDPVEQTLMAYLVARPSENHHMFYRALRGFGYQVRERRMRRPKGMQKPTRTDWDVGITIDALDSLDTYDTFVLVSGDGDFAQLLRHLKTLRKHTVVLTFASTLSRDLVAAAEEVILLSRDIVYRKDA